MDFVSPPQPRTRDTSSSFAVDAGDAIANPAEEAQGDLALSRFWKMPPVAACGVKSDTLCHRPDRQDRHSTHQRRLKLVLKLHQSASLPREDPLQMLHRLQRRIGLRTGRRRLSATQPRPPHLQPPAHPSHQRISRLQRQRPGGRLCRGLQRQPRQPRHQ